MADDDILAECGRCKPLRQQDIGGLAEAGVLSLALLRSRSDGYAILGRDLAHIDGARFEFDRYVSFEGAA